MRNAEILSLTPQPTLIAQAYDAILAAICDGRLPPGERLHQDALAARLQISRQPVGQALSILKAQGFVRDNGRRGIIVSPLEREFFRAIYQLREALDPMAARLAAERCTPADIAEGREIYAQGRRAAASGRVEALIAADMKFHLWIYRVSGNPLLLETMTLYWNHLRRTMGEVLRRGPSGKQVWEEHEAVLKAIIEQDPRAAADCALRHAADAARRVAESIPALSVKRPSAPARGAP